ncbi:hypothetical protein [Isoptericola sp. BMS4]|uniref:hypothetical protein n=1 Tax=Isoptericola sp. BMS4 TaxID=2527875 RepID=UPI0014214838|nr:hypothetical protein [Isoptericola sp. BMS4]
MRPADWSPVGLSSDPVPGDAVMVLDGGKDYLEVADSIDRAARRMSRLETGGMVSEALDALMERKEETIADIQKAHARYAATGQALVDYAGVLATAQDDSAAALERARSAAADAEDASTRQRYYVDLADGAQDVGERSQWERLAAQLGGDADAANGTVAAARAEIDSAVDVRDRAAQRAIGEIEDITSHDGLDDGWWDDWGADLVAAITDIAGWVSTVAGVLAIAVSWIPVVGQALAGVLLIVAAVAAIVNAVGNIALAATGERSWTEAVVSIAGAALSCVGLGGAAKAIGRLVTTRVLLREAGTNTHMIKAAQAGVTAFRSSHAARLLRNDPRALWESTRMWAGALRGNVDGAVDGQIVYRLYGRNPSYSGWAANADGASWTPVSPWTLENPRSTMGLPTGLESGAYNAAENIVVGELVDSSKVAGVRHGLPLDGNPGGAPEFLIPGPYDNGAVDMVLDMPFVAR